MLHKPLFVILRVSFVMVLLTVLGGCAFESAQLGYDRSHVKTQVVAAPISDSLLVFRTSGFKAWADQEAELLINGEHVAFFKAGGASYLPVKPGTNKIAVRELEHFMKCELDFEFNPGRGQFVEIYERFDPGVMMVSVVLADLQSRLAYDPHPGTECSGVYGLSMGFLREDQRANVGDVFSFHVSRPR